MKETTTKAVEYITNTLKLLPEDNRDYSYFTKFLTSYENATKLADTEEKDGILYATAIKVVHQLTSALFRLNLLDEKTEKAYREFPLPEDAEKEYLEVAKPRREASEALQKQIAEDQEKQMDVSVFIQVVNGRTEEEAREKVNAYNQTAVRG